MPRTGMASSCTGSDRNIIPYMRTRDSIHRKNSPFYGPERFTYEPENNSYRCPAGDSLNYVGLNVRNRAFTLYRQRQKVWGLFAKSDNAPVGVINISPFTR